MKFTTTILFAAFSVALVSSVPVPDNQALRSQALERLVMVEGDNVEALRSKRTIGVLRQLFPGLSQIVEQKVSAITSEVIRIFGPIILRGVLGGAGGGGNGGNNAKTTDAGTTVEIKSPFDDDDDSVNDDSTSGKNNNIVATSNIGERVALALPTFPPDKEDVKMESLAKKLTVSLTSDSAKTANASTVNAEAEDRLTEEAAESQNNEVRVQFADDQTSAGANEAVESELAPLEDIEVSDDENRNKRFLNFGFGASGGNGVSGGSGGSGGGSGNFLFDIIRLVAGSGSSQQGDVAAGAPSPGRGDGTTEAVPGPVTRLFVIANRGISNLIQDLILRLAATSERIVNFKARLITSII